MTDGTDSIAGAKFESLATALAPYFGKPIDQMPEDLRRRIIQDLVIPPWDTLTEDQRRSAAMQWDMHFDPALKDERRRLHKLAVRIHELKASEPGRLPSEIEFKRQRLAELESEFTDQVPRSVAQASEEPRPPNSPPQTEATEGSPRATPRRAPTDEEADDLVVQYKKKYGKIPNHNKAEAFAKAEGFGKARDEMRAAVDRATGSRGRGRPST